MKKEEILKVVRSNEGTVLSFPDRGPWGNNRYRGNCSGYIHAFLIDQYNVDFMAEMYAGGGTGYDICKDMQVKQVTTSCHGIFPSGGHFHIKFPFWLRDALNYKASWLLYYWLPFLL